jgi:hypothetical protein
MILLFSLQEAAFFPSLVKGLTCILYTSFVHFTTSSNRRRKASFSYFLFCSYSSSFFHLTSIAACCCSVSFSKRLSLNSLSNKSDIVRRVVRRVMLLCCNVWRVFLNMGYIMLAATIFFICIRAAVEKYNEVLTSTYKFISISSSRELIMVFSCCWPCLFDLLF